MSSVIRSYTSKTSMKSNLVKYDICAIRYNTPIRQDMAVLIAFFNPANSFRIIQNVYTVQHLLQMASIPVYIGEIANNDKPFVLQASPTTYQYKTSSIMFYKENIMAQLLQKLPDTFTKVVLLDADILFADPDWYTKVSEALDKYDVVQPFGTAHQLDLSFCVMNTNSSMLSDREKKHEGYAWAFQRAWLQKYPLFEHALVGGGDTMVYHSLSNYSSVTEFYANDVTVAIDTPLVSYVDIEILHLPHGSLQNRQYASRYTTIAELMKKFGATTVSSLVYRTPDGIFEWVNEYRYILNHAMHKYFAERNDDGI